MNAGVKTIIYLVRDLAKGKAVFGALLGVEPEMDQPYYVSYSLGGQHFGLDPNGHAQGMTGPTVYWHVTDLDGAIKALVESGAEVAQAAKDVGGGRLTATLKDADGNVIGLIQDAE